jgi:DNA-binding MarR family transcriptional regulator
MTIDYLLRTTWIAIAKMYSEKAAEFNSTMAIGLSLLSIDPKNGSLSMTLGPKMGIEPTSLSRTLSKLDELGLIERIGNNKDKRQVIIKLTPKGLEMRDISKNYVLDFQNRIAEKLTVEEIESLRISLEKIQSITQEINKNDE